MKKEKDPVDILLSEAFPQVRVSLGSAQLTWYITNKQREFVFMADAVAIIYDVVEQQLAFDPTLLKQVLGRELAVEEKKITFKGVTPILLECKFQNPDYGARVAARFIKRLVKTWGPQQLLLVPEYGRAQPKDSKLFWRAIPCIVTMRQITFHILPAAGTGERILCGV